jgi:hypothetical protein
MGSYNQGSKILLSGHFRVRLRRFIEIRGDVAPNRAVLRGMRTALEKSIASSGVMPPEQAPDRVRERILERPHAPISGTTRTHCALCANLRGCHHAFRHSAYLADRSSRGRSYGAPALGARSRRRCRPGADHRARFVAGSAPSMMARLRGAAGWCPDSEVRPEFAARSERTSESKDTSNSIILDDRFHETGTGGTGLLLVDSSFAVG